MTKQTIRFSTSVAAGESKELTKRMQADATVEEVEVRFYRGPELAVEVDPFVLRGSPEQSHRERVSLVELVGRDVVVGDADNFVFATDESVAQNETLGVSFANTAEPDPEKNLTYDVHVDIDIDTEGGLTSTSSGSWLSGVLA